MILREKVEKRNNIAKQMRALNDEIGDKKWSPEQEKRWGDMTKEHDDLDASIQREERLLKLDEDNLDNNQEERNLGADGQESKESRYNAAFENGIRRGFNNLSVEERQLIVQSRAQSVGADAEGGFTAPTQFRNQVMETMRSFGGLASIATIINTENGNEIAWPVSNGVSEMGVMLGENEEAGEGDVTFGMEKLGAKKMTSKIIRVSNELLRDSAVNMAAFLSNRIASRIGRGEAYQLIQGSGTGHNVKGLLLQANTGETTAGANSITWEELLALKHSVDPAYRAARSHWLFNDATLLNLKQMKDNQNRPLWLPSVIGDTPATFDSDPYQIDQGMDTMASGKAPVAYGDFSKVQVRRVAGMAIKRLNEKYAELDQVGFLAFHRFDMVLEDLDAVKLLKNA